MEILYKPHERNQLFRDFIDKIDPNTSKDWFNEYFQKEHAERKKFSQDFTPSSISKLTNALVGVSDNYYEACAGTGSLLIEAWNNFRVSKGFLFYRPSQFHAHLEEISDRTIPFLLFNIIFRGMNAVVVHGDTLSREIKQIYYCFNYRDDYMGFSDFNVLPHTRDVEKMFNVSKWTEEEIDHVETPLINWDEWEHEQRTKDFKTAQKFTGLKIRGVT